MSIKKTSAGWVCDVQPGGRGSKRFRKTLATRAEAERWKAWITSRATKAPDWSPDRRETRRLSDLVAEWFATHGQALRAGEDTKRRLLAMSSALGNPLADRLTPAALSGWRSERMAGGVEPSTCNRELAYLRAMFNHLGRLKSWTRENPAAALRGVKVADKELSWLTPAQIRDLLQELAKGRNIHTGMVARLALSTGARWSEAETIELQQIRAGAVTFLKTKTDRARTVPISAALEAQLLQHHAKHGENGRVFGTCYSAFREGIERAGITLPDGQLSHVLRHTFASHFMQRGGNILTLQRVLGHRDLKTTMRYAHMAPDHLAEAVRLNPLAVDDPSTERREK